MRVTSGHSDCSGHGGPVTSAADCEVAAKQLGFSYGGECSEWDCPAYPENCWYLNGKLLFNTRAISAAPCTEKHECICKVGTDEATTTETKATDDAGNATDDAANTTDNAAIIQTV